LLFRERTRYDGTMERSAHRTRVSCRESRGADEG
jgi:hypothetical protein